MWGQRQGWISSTPQSRPQNLWPLKGAVQLHPRLRGVPSRPLGSSPLPGLGPAPHLDTQGVFPQCLTPPCPGPPGSPVPGAPSSRCSLAPRTQGCSRLPHTQVVPGPPCPVLSVPAAPGSSSPGRSRCPCPVAPRSRCPHPRNPAGARCCPAPPRSSSLLSSPLRPVPFRSVPPPPGKRKRNGGRKPSRAAPGAHGGHHGIKHRQLLPTEPATIEPQR